MTRESDRTTLNRLTRIARKHIADLEKETQADNAEISSTERERKVRSLRTLLKIVEEISDIKSQLDKPEFDDQSRDFNDEQRQQLAKLIEKLAAQPAKTC